MGTWNYLLSIERTGKLPVFLQIARAIADDIRGGRLRPGERLPGTRTLAASLGIHRNTVVAAYEELVAEGWIISTAAQGTRVAETSPESLTERPAMGAAGQQHASSRVGYHLHPAPLADDFPGPTRGLLFFGGNSPDVRLLPVDSLGRAYRRALRAHGHAALNYGDPTGHPRLRSALAAMLARTRGLAADADSVFITRGSQMAFHLIARALVTPGDVVAVESLGYRQAWEAFRLAGARLVAVPVDEHGIDVDALKRLMATETLRAIYLTPHHQFPTTVTLVPGRRRELLALAAVHRVAIIEDDYDHEFHYDDRPVLPLASADQKGVVIYVATLSKVLAPGLRIGYVVAPHSLIEHLAAFRRFVDIQGDQIVECAVAELMEDGEVQRHVHRIRRVYMARRAILMEALRRELDGALTFTQPAGGVALWVQAATGIDVDAWAERATAHGVAFATARLFAFDRKSRPAARLGFATLSEAELPEAVRRLAAAGPT